MTEKRYGVRRTTIPIPKQSWMNNGDQDGEVWSGTKEEAERHATLHRLRDPKAVWNVVAFEDELSKNSTPPTPLSSTLRSLTLTFDIETECDPELTCFLCHRNLLPCEFTATVYGDGRTSTVGLHQACAEWHATRREGIQKRKAKPHA